MKIIIIADENSTARNLIRLIFTECMGYRVVAASSGADAVLKARAIKPDVVLADVSLHDKDGYEVSRGIKNDLLLQNTYVILLAASLETFDARRAAEVRADDFIIKPFEPNQIIKKLEFLTTPREEHSRSLVIRTPERKNLPFDRVTMLLATFILVIPILYKSIDFSPYEPNSKTTADSGVGVKRIVSEAKKAPVEKTGFVRRDVSPSELKYQNDEKAYTVGLRQFIEEETLKDKDQIEVNGEGIPNPEEVLSEELNGSRYVVKEGDSLWRIANRFNISVGELKIANRVNGSKLDVGDVLIIPLIAEEEPGKGYLVELETMEELMTASHHDENETSEKNERKVEREAVATVEPEEGYTVQIGAFHEEERARKITQSLMSKGYPVFIETVQVPRQGIWHRVRVGTFGTEEEARFYADNLKSREPLIKEVIVIN